MEEITVQVKLLQNDFKNNKVVEFDDASAPKIHTTSSSSSSPEITPMLVLSAFVAVLGSFSFGFVTGYTSPVQDQIMKELNLSIAEYSLFGSMYSVGGALGAIICGKITDYFGRNHALTLSDVLYIFGWFSISVGKSAWMLDLGRWMLGVAMAVAGYAIPVYIAEFTPKDYRGGFVILHVLMLTVGTSAALLIGLVTSWRTLALIGIFFFLSLKYLEFSALSTAKFPWLNFYVPGTIPSLVQIVGLFFIPESPRWLLMMSKNKKFEEALQHLRGDSADISQEAADIRECTEALHQLESVNIVQLFQKKYAYSLTVGIGLSALTMLVGLGGIICYADFIFESAGLPAMVGTIALAVFQLLSVGFGIMLMDKYGRRPLLKISAAGLCLGSLLASLSFLLQEHHLLGGFSPYIALIGILIYVTSYPIGVGGASSIIISEIYPLNIKGLAGSLAALACWSMAWVVTYVFNFAMKWSSSGTFLILAGICAFALIFVTKLVPETKGKTLEEIHMSISEVWQ